MKYKNNVMLQYTLGTFMVITIVTVVMGSLLSSWTRNILIRQHLALYPEIIKEYLIEHDSILKFIQNPVDATDVTYVDDFMTDIKAFDAVFRVKVWDVHGDVIWSDDAGIVGKQFSDNEEYEKALQGVIQYEISKPDQAENLSEKDYKQVLEIYIPVYQDTQCIGVIELYESTNVLFEEIQKDIYYVWGIIIGAGLVIYGLLFLIFYSSHKRLKQINANLLKTQQVTIMSLASLSEIRDDETGAHIKRTQSYIRALTEYLKKNSSFKKYLTKERMELLVLSSPLHDIGKVGVPDAILLKPGKLTPEEFEIMKMHTVYGHDALKIAEDEFGFNSFINIGSEIVYTHHEKWDGSGYPRGLKGDEIPIPGRLMALADVYDALTSKRVYKEAFSHEVASDIIVQGRGTHFDPEIVDAFMQIEEVFRQISEEQKDYRS